MKKRRVAMVLNSMGFGGVTEVAYQLLRVLPRDSFHFDVCVLSHKSKSEEREWRENTFRDIGIAVHAVSASREELQIISGAAELFGNLEIDIIHTHSFRPNIFGRMAGLAMRSRGTRMIAHYHNQYDNKWNEAPHLLSLERHLAFSTDAFLAVSDSVREHVAQRIGIPQQRITTVQNAIDGTHFAHGDRAKGRELLGLHEGDLGFVLVGRVCQQKGQDLFVEAAIAVSQLVPEAVFVMAGDIEDKHMHTELKQRIEDEGLSSRVRFIGYQTQMAEIYAGADIIVAPSRWEGFGLMIAEAMAAGRPIIAAAAGAIPEIVRDRESGLLVPPADSTALSAAMRELAGNAQLQRRYGDAGRDQQSANSWQKAANQIASIYDSVLY